MVQVPTGNLEMVFNLRSVYDSTQVWVDGVIETTIGPNEAKQIELLSLPVTSAGTRTAFARAFKDGMTYDTVTKQVDVIVVSEPVVTYSNDFTNASDADDFARNDIVWDVPGGFSNGALHTYHNYYDNASPTAALLTPILVTTTSMLSFDEIAIVEPGEPGSVFGDSDFWDYVLVEATEDGINWIPLDGAWDARDDPVWLSTYYSGGDGNSTMYQTREIELTNHFSAGDVIILRFRMYADAAVTAWGWAIDNVIVSSDYVAAVGDVPAATSLGQNYPNPFNPKTTISFTLDRSEPVKLQVFDVRGRVVRTLVNEVRAAGAYRIDWDGKDNGGRAAASGLYLYRLEAGDFVQQRKMTLLK
jgi:hypothetical protein